MKTVVEIITNELLNHNIEELIISTDEDWLYGKRVWLYIKNNQREEVEKVINVITPMIKKTPSCTDYKIKDIKIFVKDWK